MNSLLAGKTIVITGAGDGVGRGIALACGAAGAQVVVAARRRELGARVVAEIEAENGSALFVTCDVTKRQDFEHTLARSLERFGRVDALVHNATSNRSPEPGALEDLDVDLWEQHCSVSLRGSYFAAQSAFEALGNAAGQLILLTSPAGIQGSGALPFYSIVKGAQRAFVKSLAQEWGPFGIRVNAISPLATSPALVRAFETDPQFEARLAAKIPMGRVGDPRADIGAAAVLLLSDGAGFITGQTWVVDGGRFTGL